MVYGKPCRGVLGKFGEPVCAYLKTHLKGEKTWHKALFLGKTEGQDSFIVYDGSKVLLTKSIRRIGQEWGLSLAYYKEFGCPTFDYQTGLDRGSFLRRERLLLPVLPNLVPLESIAVKAKAVIKKAIEENRKEDEARRMLGNDPKSGAFEAAPIEDGDEDAAREEAVGETTTTTEPTFSYATSTLSTSPPQASSTAKEAIKGEEEKKNVVFVDDNTTLEALMQPRDVTIEFKPSGGASGSGQSLAGEARSSPTTRGLDEHGDEREGKRLRTEDAKKARINRMKDEMENKIRTITIGDEVFYTLDEEIETAVMIRIWNGTQRRSRSLRSCGWMAFRRRNLRTLRPTSTRLQISLKVGRLIKMEVIKHANNEDKNITRSVTTKFVRDWRWKEYKSEGTSRNRWLRRSRLVARQYAVDKRGDVFSPASSGHLLRLLPVLYLAEVGELREAGRSEEDVTLCTMDIKDAFLQVPQEEPLRLRMPGGDYIALKNLPGQRIGAKAWFDYFSAFLAEELGYEACPRRVCAKGEIEV